jgi:two-component system, OmpR family, sensor kinase
MQLPFRARLILAYTLLWVLMAAFTLAIAIYSVRNGLYGQIERSLVRYVEEVANLYSSGRAGEISFPVPKGGISIGIYSPSGQPILVPSEEQVVPKQYLREANLISKPYYARRFMAAYRKIPGGIIAVSQDTRYIETISTTLRNSLWRGMLVLLPIGALLIVLAASVSLVPLHRAAQEINQRGPRNLSPIPYTGPKDDLGVMVERVNELLAELQEARYRERAFLAEVSHELRTPITSLSGYLDRLGRNPSDAHNLEGAKRTATHLTRMVGDLLALARGEAERSVNAHIVNLGDLLKQVVNEYPGVLLKIPSEFPEVLGDPDRLMQLARNLVANAVRAAGSPSKVQVRVWMVKEPTDHPRDPYKSRDETLTTSTPEMQAAKQPWGVFSVVDFGPGISPEVMPRLFTRFARGPEGGTGLGLAIAKQIAEAHRGEIRVASRPGETRFTVFLPLLEEDSA